LSVQQATAKETSLTAQLNRGTKKTRCDPLSAKFSANKYRTGVEKKKDLK
jgi:hypothetical protein